MDGWMDVGNLETYGCVCVAELDEWMRTRRRGGLEIILELCAHTHIQASFVSEEDEEDIRSITYDTWKSEYAGRRC